MKLLPIGTVAGWFN
ncbi:Protein of unknown function [Bacillus cereus]|nr:Protein of unknown function [Bacillus cereus]